jgi:hypothetical protein
LNNIKSNAKKINLIIENEDGIQTIIEIFNAGWTAGNTVLVVVVPVIGIGIATLVVLEIKKKFVSQKILRKS